MDSSGAPRAWRRLDYRNIWPLARGPVVPVSYARDSPDGAPTLCVDHAGLGGSHVRGLLARLEEALVSQSRWVVPSVLGVWLLAATAVGAAGLLVDLVPPWPQVILVGLTLLSLAFLWSDGPVRRWAARVDVRLFVAFHIIRFVGVYFLVLYGRGQLPYEFAVIGGWGDIIVATLAVLLIATGPPDGPRRTAYLVWNAAGLADILFVVATATRLALADPTSLAPMLRLPLSLLITFVVPIVIATHIWLFRRLGKSDDGLVGPNPGG